MPEHRAPELIQHGVDGWLVRPGSEEEFATAIAQLMVDPELRKRLGAAGRLRVQTQYELETNVMRLAEIFERRLSA